MLSMFNAEADLRLTLYPVDLDALADVDDLDPADVRVYDSATDPSSENIINCRIQDNHTHGS